MITDTKTQIRKIRENFADLAFQSSKWAKNLSNWMQFSVHISNLIFQFRLNFQVLGRFHVLSGLNFTFTMIQK